MSIDVQHISKTFGTFKALSDVSLAVPDGELVALLGPSGSGKTTLLRIIAGLEEADEAPGAAVLFGGENVVNRAVRDRRVGFVFQHYALFRQMNVFENIAFGLRVRPRKTRPPAAEIRRKVMELLQLVQLEGMEKRHPSQLSGGQRQRVAIARALVTGPDIVLADEPTANLDSVTGASILELMRQMNEVEKTTFVFSTHDAAVLKYARRIVRIKDGLIEKEPVAA